LIFSLIHPCFITKGIGWENDVKGNHIKLTISDYFTEDHWLEEWHFSKAPMPEDTAPFKVPRFPRTISGYINSLMENGFILERLHEPRPSERMCRDHPWLDPWRKHASLFLYIRAKKSN
jgi:hypothetical protein